jgi:protein-tyrosine phosphatase
MPSILFVCTANLYRSPLAAALLRRKLRAEAASPPWLVESAGTWTPPGLPAPGELLAAAEFIGIDLKSHLTRQVDLKLLEQFDLVLVMERGHREALGIEFPSQRQKLHLLSELADGLEYDIADPARSRMRVGEFIAGMSALIERAYAGICRRAQPQTAPDYSSPHDVNITL